MGKRLFEKGNPGGPGRPKGSKTRSSLEKLDLQVIGQECIGEMLELARHGNDNARVRAYSALLPYVLRKQPTEVVNSEGKTQAELRQEVISELLESIYTPDELQEAAEDEQRRQELERTREHEVATLRARIADLEGTVKRESAAKEAAIAELSRIKATEKVHPRLKAVGEEEFL